MAHRLGLSLHSSKLLVRGQSDGFEVRISRASDRDGGDTEIIVRPEPSLSSALTLTAMGMLERMVESVSGAADVGDPDFDEAVAVMGGLAELCAALDPEGRRVVGDAVADGLVVHDGEIRVTVEGSADAADIEPWVSRALDVGRHLAIAPGHIPGGLLDRMRERSPSVRRRAFDLLFERYSTHLAFDEALRIAHEDEDFSIRLEAANRAGEAGLTAFRHLVLDPETPDDVREAAFERLSERFETVRVAPIAVEAWGGSIEAQITRWLVRSGGEAAIAPVLAALPGAGDAEAARALDTLRQLSSMHHPGIEAAMIDALARPDAASRPLSRLAACEGLALLGQADALEVLLPLTDRPTVPGPLKAAAWRAVNAIRERRGVGPVGGLTVVDPKRAGGLALSEAAPSIAERLDRVDGLERARVRLRLAEAQPRAREPEE